MKVSDRGGRLIWSGSNYFANMRGQCERHKLLTVKDGGGQKDKKA